MTSDNTGAIMLGKNDERDKELALLREKVAELQQQLRAAEGGREVKRELKPCPFCGDDVHLGKAEYPQRATPNDPVDFYWYIGCVKCDAMYMDTSWDGESREWLIERWNRRPVEDEILRNFYRDVLEEAAGADHLITRWSAFERVLTRRGFKVVSLGR